MRERPACGIIGIVAVCSFLGAAAPAVAVAQNDAVSAITLVNNETQPVYSLGEAIRTVVDIETPVDTAPSSVLRGLRRC